MNGVYGELSFRMRWVSYRQMCAVETLGTLQWDYFILCSWLPPLFPIQDFVSIDAAGLQ